MSDSGQAIATSAARIVHVVGASSSSEFPQQNPLQAELKDFGSVHASANAAASWSRTGLSGVSVQALAVDPTNAQILYAGTYNGVYKSANGGANWTRVDSGLAQTNVVALAINPNLPCTIYGGLKTYSTTTNTNAILIVSTNCGVSWGYLFGFPLGSSVLSLGVTNVNPSTIYFSLIRNTATWPEHSVARTTAGDAEYLYPGAGNYRIATDPANACTAYAGSSQRVFKNTSCAIWNWTTVGSTLDGGVNAVAPHPTNQSTLLAGTSAGTLYRKVDDANPWAPVATLSGGVTSIVYHPGDPQVVYASGSGTVYKSTNGGASWAAAKVDPIVKTIFAGNKLRPDGVFGFEYCGGG